MKDNGIEAVVTIAIVIAIAVAAVGGYFVISGGEGAEENRGGEVNYGIKIGETR